MIPRHHTIFISYVDLKRLRLESLFSLLHPVLRGKRLSARRRAGRSRSESYFKGVRGSAKNMPRRSQIACPLNLVISAVLPTLIFPPVSKKTSRTVPFERSSPRYELYFRCLRPSMVLHALVYRHIHVGKLRSTVGVHAYATGLESPALIREVRRITW